MTGDPIIDGLLIPLLLVILIGMVLLKIGDFDHRRRFVPGQPSSDPAPLPPRLPDWHLTRERTESGQTYNAQRSLFTAAERAEIAEIAREATR